METVCFLWFFSKKKEASWMLLWVGVVIIGRVFVLNVLNFLRLINV